MRTTHHYWLSAYVMRCAHPTQLSVEDIYERVQNGDISEWLENKEKLQQQVNAATDITV